LEPVPDENPSPEPPANRCRDCGAALPPGLPKGLCSQCALRGALALGGDASGTASACRGCGATTSVAEFVNGLCPECLVAAMRQMNREPATAETVAVAVAGDALAKAGRHFGDYELLEEIARGGMGVVYKARQVSLGRLVAVKLLLRGEFASEDFIKRFRIEATAAASLQHPNIVAIHEVGVHQGQHYFAMDLVDGPNLARLLRDGPLPAKRAAGYVKSIAEAIHFAHTRHILHRDLKPSNVLIDSSDRPRVTDFGLAKNLASDSGLTATGQIYGTPSFMPPEQSSGQRGKVGVTSDVYSLGANLYHALTGRPPFVGQSVADTLKQVENKEPIAPRLLNPSVPRDLETICLKCLQKEQDRRYSSAQELAEELGRFLRDESIRARPLSQPVRLHRWVRRNRILTGLVAAIGAVALLIGSNVFDWWQGRQLRREFAIALEHKWDDLAKGLISNIPLSSAELAAATGRRVTQNPNAQRLRVGIYTETDQVLTIEQLAPFLQRVERGMSRSPRSTPVQVDLYMYLKREPLEAALLDGLIDIVRLGEGPLVRLRRADSAITPLVQQVSGGKTGAIFVAVSSSITNLFGLRGRSIAAGSPTSTSSGYKLFEVLLKARLHFKDLNKLEFQDSSEGNPRLVAEGKFDAAVGRKEKVTGSLTNRFRILAEFPTTTMPWASRAKLDPAIGRAFIDALVGMKDRRLLGNLPDDATQGFKPADTNHFREPDQNMRAAEDEFFGPSGNPATPPA
jgi:serine/threonine protein kinase